MTTIDLTPAQEEALVAAILALGNLSSVPPKHRASLVEVRDILYAQRHPAKHSESALDDRRGHFPYHHYPHPDTHTHTITESELRALDGDR